MRSKVVPKNDVFENNFSAIKCESEDRRYSMVTRWELGNDNLSNSLRYLHIDYSGMEKKFEEEKSKADITEEMKDMFSTLPKSIGNHIELKVLKVYSESNESICLNTLPTTIGNLRNLQILDLSHNKLKSLPDYVGNLKNLQTLDLSSNELKTLPDTIGKLKYLLILDVSNNMLTTLPNSIGNIKNLEELYISRNHAFSKLPNSIGNLINLLALELNCTNILELPETMENLTNIENLALSKSVIERSTGNYQTYDYPSDWYYSFVRQSLMYWICTPIDFNGCKETTTLNLSGINLKQIPFGLHMIIGLQELDISNNQITKLPPLLKKLEYLRKLVIHNNPNLNHLPDFLWEMYCLDELKIDGKLIDDLPDYAKISLDDLDNKILEENIEHLTLAGNDIHKLSDEELSCKTGPYTVYLNKNEKS